MLALFLFISSLTFANYDSLLVRGEGEIKVKPDIAHIQLNVFAKAKEAKSAQAKNAKEMERVKKVLIEDFGLEAKDLSTEHFSLNPDYRWDNNRQHFMGYTVSHSLQAKVRKLENIGKILDAIVPEKASEDLGVQLNGIQFDTEKRRDYETQAIGEAMKNARVRAEALAKFAGKNLKQVRRISDSNINFTPFMPAQLRGARMESDSGMMKMAAAPRTNIESGEISVSSSVTVEFEF